MGADMQEHGTTPARRPTGRDTNVVSTARLLGVERRWRRFGPPVAAGESSGPDGAPDFGLFGPGSAAWEVLLHPLTIALESVAQGVAQLLYKPIAAGIRDGDPISRKGRQGTLTFFDSFERFQRNAGMHAPMWFGDSTTARRMAEHLHRIHGHVAGDVIDIGEPELGGYAASEPRDAMWAALTEMHPVLRAYEAFAFRHGRLPRRLPDEARDRYVAEFSAYVRLVGGADEEAPTSTAELAVLYERYADLFRHSPTIDLLPDTGEDYQQVMADAMRRNFHPTQLRAIAPLLMFVMFRMPVLGALSARARRSAGLNPVTSALAAASAKAALPVMWLLQQPPSERFLMRLMWGPDGVRLIESARELHRRARPTTAVVR